MMFIFVPSFDESRNKFGPSSNGRTTDFGSVCVGSNPAGPTITKPFAFAEGFVFRYLKAILIFLV